MTELAIFGVMFVLTLGTVGLIVWNGRRVERVRNNAIVMSRSAEDRASQHAPSSPETDGRQTDQTPIVRRPAAEELLTVYKLMRKYNIPREEARAALKASNLPLDNNLWTSAAPPIEEPTVSVTPIAGRETSAEFRDPKLIYQPPLR